MWKLKSGETIVDRHNSHLHDGIELLLPEALSQIDSGGRQFLVEEVDFGHLIGETTCVATGPSDVIIYAKRPKRFGLTRFVKNRQPTPCNAVVVILKAATDKADTYVLVTAFIGHQPRPEPWDTRNFSQQPDPVAAERESRDFWASHALVWDSEPVVPGTETIHCPWRI